MSRYLSLFFVIYTYFIIGSLSKLLMFEAVYFRNTSLSIYQAAWKIIFGHLQLLFGRFLSTILSLTILHHTFERYHTPNSIIAYSVSRGAFFNFVCCHLAIIYLSNMNQYNFCNLILVIGSI
jgi:hypothetical protein